MTMNKIPCSISILTFNSASSLRLCLESVKEFSDIVVCDGGSTDNTIAIANEYDCKIIYQDQRFKNSDNTIADFSGVRNQLLSFTAHDWFMYIDSDEYISRGLVEEIREVIEKNQPSMMIFDVPRKYVKDGRIIDCATTYPNYQTRFFNKKAVNGFIRNVHEKIQPKDGYSIAKLKNYEYVPLESLRVLKKKWKKYLTIETKKEKEESFMAWVFSGLLYHVAISILYFLRYIKIILFCKGNKMPPLYEALRLWYNLEVIKIGFYRIIKKYKKKIFV